MTRAIAALLEIMSDAEAPLRRRIEATAGLLAYEAPPEAVEQAKAFLTSVFEDAEQRVDDRLDAIKLMRKAEGARKITAPTVTPEDARKNRELWREIEIGMRRVAMMKAGLWPPEEGWCNDLMGDDYVAPAISFDEAWRNAFRYPNARRAKTP
jgi:hypothetical protein